ncbi:MAG: LysE family transporter [Bradymonadaceae bacterium]
MEIIILSIAAGFLAAVPAMGPSSAIIIRRILVGHERKGLAFAELMFYTAPFLKPILQWVGLALLLGVGVYFALGIGCSDEEADSLGDEGAGGLGGQFVFGFGLTALNPALVAGWATAIGVALSTTGIELATWQKWTIPFGIVTGETLWFMLLIGLSRRFDDYLDERVIDGIIRVVGVVLIGLAIYSGYQTWIGVW